MRGSGRRTARGERRQLDRRRGRRLGRQIDSDGFFLRLDLGGFRRTRRQRATRRIRSIGHKILSCIHNVKFPPPAVKRELRDEGVAFWAWPWHAGEMNAAAPRLDKWLWAVRAFKTRTQAAEACRLGRVTIGGQRAKPARDVVVGDTILVQQGQMTRTLKVLGWLEQRVGAAVARDYCEDLTPPAEYEKRREPNFQPIAFRPKGSGRPTKKERRALPE